MQLRPLPELRPPIRIRQIEIGATERLLVEDDLRYDDMLLLVRLHGHPIGLVGARPPRTTDEAAEIVREAQLALQDRIEAHLRGDQTGHGAQTVPPDGMACNEGYAASVRNGDLATVVIATRDRTEDLRQVLDSLVRLEYSNAEVIVVDNAPRTKETEALVAEFSERHSRVRYVREDVPGLSVARNRGVIEAKGEIVAFTDDDAVVDPQWLGRLCSTFDLDGNIACVLGLVLPSELETEPQLWYEYLGGFPKAFEPALYDLGRHRPKSRFFPLSTGNLGSGNNMAFRRSALLALGLFDPGLGAGTPCRGEDSDMFFRVVMSGRTLAYAPSAIIWHKHRRDYKGLLRQVSDQATTVYLTKHILSHPSEALALGFQVPPALLAYLFGPRGKYTQEALTVPLEFRLADLKALMLGPVRYLASRRSARHSEPRTGGVSRSSAP